MCVAALVMLGGQAALAPVAHAGSWILAACANPDGSSAPSEGWTSGTAAPSGGGPAASTQCNAAVPMKAVVSDVTPASNGTSATLTFTPPAGSTLVGGSVDASLYAGGFNGFNAAANAELSAPSLSPGNAFADCNVFVKTPSCGQSNQVSNVFQVPGDTGGSLYAQAACTGQPGYPCNSGGGGDAAWADAEIHWARLLLSSNESPTGTGFSGSALAGRVRGTAHVVFSAAEPAGPGIYDTTVQIDGLAVWHSIPNDNDPACNPVNGSIPMMFDNQQPCPTTETVDASVPTGGLPDGRHELAVLVFDAAENRATVLDQNIVTANPQTTPNPHGRRALHARFVINWTWGEHATRLDHVAVTHLPRHARVTVRCAGRGCPRLRVRSVTSAGIKRLLRELDGRRFTAGDVLYLTVVAPGHRTERVRLQIRVGVIPQASLAR